MADELKTGLVLDLNTKEIESDLANFTSEINKVIAEIGKIQSEMDKLGPKAGESFKDMGATFGKLLQSMRTTAQNMSNAMIDKAAFSDTKTELDHIIARLTDVETRLKTALNPQAINDMMNALQKLNDVFGRINLGKLEVTFKNMESSFENISTKLSEVIDKAKDISDALAKIDLSKLRQDDSSTEAESKKSTEALKEEAKAASMTADAWDKVRKARAQAVKNTKEQSVSRERNQLEDLRRFAAEEAFGDAVPDDKQVDISQLSKIRTEYQKLFDTLDDSSREGAEGNRIQGVIDSLQLLEDTLGAVTNNLSKADQIKFGTLAGGVLNSLETLSTVNVGDVEKFTTELWAQMQQQNQVAQFGQLNDGLTEFRAFVNEFVEARFRLVNTDREAVGDEQSIQGIDFEKYENAIQKASSLMEKWKRSQSDGGRAPTGKTVNNAIKDMQELEALMGDGIKTPEWDSAIQGLYKIREELIATKKEAKGTTDQVFAQMDEKFVQSIENMTQSLAGLVSKMDKFCDDAMKVSKAFGNLDDDAGRPPWADWFKETTGQAGIADMNEGILMLVESLDKLSDKATHMVQIINRMFLSGENGKFFGDARAGIELMLEGLDKLDQKAADSYNELSRMGGVNTGIDADTMRQMIEQSKKTGQKQQAGREKTLNQLYSDQRARLKEIYDLKAKMRREEGDADDQKKRIEALNESYARAKVKMEGMANAAEKLNKLENYEKDLLGKDTFEQDKKIVAEVEQAVRSLIKAQNEYRTAEKNGDEAGKAQRQTEIDAAKRLIDEKVKGQDIDKMALGHQERIKKAIAESTAQQAKHTKQLEAMKKASDEINRYFQQMTQWVMQMLIINKLQEAWRDAVEYAKTYYDAMNEIRVVTGMTQEEADALGESYRQMAKEMNLTSTEIAKSAVDIYRQGYGSAADVAGVSKGAAVFGAITSMDTDKAMNTMTAALQNFQREGESMEHLAFRIADSWSYLGDAVATEASDIGDAMSKVAGSATNVGLSLEQTSAWAAVVMAKTQESAETIGTSLNSMITRYTKLTAGGFNSIITDEDGEQVAFNDVSKALQSVGIATYSAAEGFRDYGSVMDELGGKWKNLSAAQQNYIAFQMAGTRNMNRFITLMNNYGEATELTNTALSSSGTAMEKYAIWMETVEAAQNNLQSSLEDLYALLLDGSVVRGFYNGLAGMVDWFNAGTEAAGQLNILLPGIAAGIALVSVAINALTKTTGGVKGWLTSHPVITIAAAFAALVPLATAAAHAVERFANADKYAAEAASQLADELSSQRSETKKLADGIGRIEGVTNPTTEELNGLKDAIARLSTVAPDLAEKFDLDAGAIDNFAGTLGRAKAALEEYLKTERYAAFKTAHEGIGNAEDVYDQAYNNLYGSGKGQYLGHTASIDNVADMRKQIAWRNEQLQQIKMSISAQMDGAAELYGMTAEYILDTSTSISELESLRDQLMAAGSYDWNKKYIEANFGTFINGKKEFNAKLAELALDQAHLDSILADNKQKIQQSIQIMINDVLNPAAYPELSFEDMLNIETLLGNFDYTKLSFDKARALMEDIVAKYNDTFRSVIENANVNMAMIDEFGMSEMIFDSIVADLNNTDYADIKPYLNQMFGSYIYEWTKAKSEFKKIIGSDNVAKLIAAGFDGEKLLGTIADSLDAGLPEGVSMQEVIDQILSFDPNSEAGKGYDHADWIRHVFDQMGVETKESISDLEAILKAGNEAINEQIQNLGKQKIVNNGYKDIFDGMLNGGKSLQEVSMELARGILGETATAEAVADLGADIAKSFIDANPGIALAIDRTYGTIKTGMDGIVSLLANAEVRDLINELGEVDNSTDARGAAGEVLSEGLNIQQAKEAMEILQTAEKGTVKYTDALKTVADYMGVPVEAMGDLSAAAQAIDGDMAKFNEKISELLNYFVETEQVTVDENGEIQAAGDDAEFLAEVLGLVLECFDMEMSDGSWLLKLRDLTAETADGMTRLSELAAQIREDESENEAAHTGYKEYLDQIREAGSDGAAELFNQFDEDIQSAIANEYPELVKTLDDIANGALDGEDALAALNKQLDKAGSRAAAKRFKNTADALGDLEKNAVTVDEAVSAYRDDMDDLIDATEAFEKIKMSGITADTADELDKLAAYLGTTSDLLEQNWDASGISNALAQASAEGQSYLNALQEAAFIELALQGRSDVDFSAVKNQLIATEGLAADAVAELQRLGLFEIKTVGMDAVYYMLDAVTGQFKEMTAKNEVQVLVPTAANPLKTGGGRVSGGSGGSGGGGSGSKKPSKKTQGLVDEIDQTKELYDYRLKLIELAKEYYGATGELEGVKSYTEQELMVRKEQAEAVKEYIAQLKAEIAAKEATMAKSKSTSKAYKQAKTDLDALNEALEEAIEEYAGAETAIVELTQAMEDLREEQRQTAISVEEMIRDVLQTEEEAAEDMLDGRKEVEDEILALIEARYERQKELDIEAAEAAIEAAEARQDAIDQEINALDEALAKRKELAEQAKDEQELAELEAKYARISADPTRAREALELQQQIRDKREEMAWEAAEAEVEAQKEALEKESEAIDEEIENLEDKIEAIEEAFEALIESPKKMITEMLALLTMSDAEIIEWLKANSEEYAKGSEVTQQQMVNGWQDMLDRMHGKNETYKDQIKEIMGWTDEEIINWLKEHSVEFEDATVAQQESFLKGWKDTLKEWRNAYKDTSDEIIELTGKVSNNIGSSSGSGSGSGSGSSGGVKTTTSGTVTTAADKGKRFEQNGTGSGTADKSTLVQMVEDGLTYIKDRTGTYWYRLNDAETSKDGKQYIWYNDKRYVKKYAQGGIADYTGLAWMDGSSSKPERVLNWKQNQLFESLVKTLERMSEIRIPVPQFTMPAFGDAFKNRSEGNVTIENVTVHVEKLESDADYELMADKVGEVIGKRLVKGKAIGGIRIR